MRSVRHVAVIDIGKTNTKLALVDLETRTEIAALRQPNRVRDDGPYPHHDVEAIWSFVIGGLTTLRRDRPIDAISVTTHGATAALIDCGGKLAVPVLDYEFHGPETTRDAYDALRPPFDETGSPPLPLGLNLGAQLFWQQQSFPDAFARTAAILTYPQYWAWRLTGVMASEVTSLGCHTDLWSPRKREFSALVGAMGLHGLFPTLRPANAVLGPIHPEIAARSGLDPTTPVACGIHDSNASLLPHLADREQPFAVVSTGTWVVAMSIGGRPIELDAGRDTLVNVDALGDPVPSARFMGGREFEVLMAGHPQHPDASDLAAAIERQAMLLPSTVGGSGPFPRRQARWVTTEPQGGQRHVAVSFYLALMTATCLDLVGAEGDVVVEGPFAANDAYLAMLAAATGRPVAANPQGSTGTSIGAALLATDLRRTAFPAVGSLPFRSGPLLHYAAEWRRRTC